MTRQVRRLVIALAGCTALGCSIFSSVDDLEGSAGDGSAGTGGASGGGGGGAAGSIDGGATCTADKGCVGCASCSTFCACSKPFAIAACMAAECPDSGTDGSAGADGAADAPSDDCTDPSLYGKPCEAADDGSECGKCLVTTCCPAIDDCFASEPCARGWACYRKHCADNTVDPIQCLQDHCGSCYAQDSAKFLAVGTCSFSNCQTECASP